jgi:hypothetical protein
MNSINHEACSQKVINRHSFRMKELLLLALHALLIVSCTKNSGGMTGGGPVPLPKNLSASVQSISPSPLAYTGSQNQPSKATVDLNVTGGSGAITLDVTANGITKPYNGTSFQTDTVYGTTSYSIVVSDASGHSVTTSAQVSVTIDPTVALASKNWRLMSKLMQVPGDTTWYTVSISPLEAGILSIKPNGVWFFFPDSGSMNGGLWYLQSSMLMNCGSPKQVDASHLTNTNWDVYYPDVNGFRYHFTYSAVQ